MVLCANFQAVVWDVWKPTSTPRLSWDCFMLLGLVYVLLVSPYLIAFSISTVRAGCDACSRPLYHSRLQYQKHPVMLVAG
jgi:hypothetical protein